jgi:uridine kinase
MEVVHLYNIYNREDGGDLTGELTIDLHGGGILVVEGVAVAHLRAQGLVDILIYVETREDIRRVRLLQRDGDRRRGVEAEKRWRLTQAFEQRYFAEYKRLADFRLNNDNE